MKKIISMIILIAIIIIGSVTAYARYEPDFSVESQSIFLINLDSEMVVYEKNADKKIFPAHLNMVMTAIIAIEYVKDLDAVELTFKQYQQDMVYKTSASALAGMVKGETMSVREVLYGMMLQSGNDTALMLADYVGDGSIDYFVEMMNSKAKEIGCTNTVFSTPTGLYKADNVSTAKDMYLIAKYAMELPGFMEIVNSKSYTVGDTNKRANLFFTNNNRLINSSSASYYKLASGIKYASSEQGGRSIISTASKDGFPYMLVLMDAPIYDKEGEVYETNYAFKESADIYNWAFATFKVKTLLDKGKNISEVKVSLGKDTDFVMLMSEKRFSALIPDDIEASSVILEPVLPEYIQAPVTKGMKIGYVRLILANEEVGQVALVAVNDVELSQIKHFFHKILMVFNSFWVKFGIAFVVLTIIVYILVMVVRNNNQKRYKSGMRHRKL